MTSLDPSHLPSRHDDNLHGQAVHTSVSALHPQEQADVANSCDEDSEHDDADRVEPTASTSTPAWKGAWKRRQEAKEREKEQQKQDVRKHGKIPVPPIPDLRYEQGVLLSIRPFMHRAAASSSSQGQPHLSAHHQEKVEAGEKGALVSSALTAEGAETGLGRGEDSDIFSGPLTIQWAQVSYVLFRDQFVYPLLQGLLWGVGSLWLGSLWAWNRARLDAKAATSVQLRPSSGPSLLTRLGLKTR